MFGKRDPSASGDPKAPPPAPAGGAAIATRPQRIEPAAPPEPKAPAPKVNGPAPKATAG
ncbi:MAG: CpaF family protein, partial [Caulobacter sp.]|nr:CpaF family protein [Caulobacter sp.]